MRGIAMLKSFSPQQRRLWRFKARRPRPMFGPSAIQRIADDLGMQVVTQYAGLCDCPTCRASRPRLH